MKDAQDLQTDLFVEKWVRWTTIEMLQKESNQKMEEFAEIMRSVV